MSSAAVLWADPRSEHAEEATEHRLVAWSPDEESATQAYEKWHSILRARHLSFGPSKGATDEDLALESPTWLKGRLTELQSRRFIRRNDPRRKSR